MNPSDEQKNAERVLMNVNEGDDISSVLAFLCWLSVKDRIEIKATSTLRQIMP